jgi:hypothetical protein
MMVQTVTHGASLFLTAPIRATGVERDSCATK